MLSRWISLAIWTAPLVGVGVVQLSTGRAIGTGIQPSMLVLAMAMVHVLVARSGLTWPRRSGSVVAGGLFVAWVVASTALTWTSPSLGFAGEAPWSKSAKQAMLWVFFVAVATLPTMIPPDRRERAFRNFEVAATGSLVLTLLVAALQAWNFQFPSALGETVMGWFSSNPSIASGSGELYLGHSFVGIPRLRATFPEPLHYGSFLAAVVPIVALTAAREQGWSRFWRSAVAVVGLGALGMTFSRGAWLGFSVTAACISIGSGLRILPRPGARALVLVGVGLVASSFLVVPAVTGSMPWEIPGLLLRRLRQSGAGHDMSNLTRFWSWRAAWDLWLESPLLGHGWGSFGFHYFRLAGPSGAGAHFGWPVTNNLPLQIFAELGVLGAALAGGALGFLGACLRGRAGRPAFVLAACVMGQLVQLLTYSQWNMPHLWLLLGLTAAARTDRR